MFLCWPGTDVCGTAYHRSWMIEKKGWRAEECRVSGVLPAYGGGWMDWGSVESFLQLTKYIFP